MTRTDRRPESGRLHRAVRVIGVVGVGAVTGGVLYGAAHASATGTPRRAAPSSTEASSGTAADITASDSTAPTTAGNGPGWWGPRPAPVSATVTAKVTAAIHAALPGSTVERVHAARHIGGTAAYAAHVTKSDGTRVEVALDSSYKILRTTTDHGPGRWRGGPDRGPQPTGPSGDRA